MQPAEGKREGSQPLEPGRNCSSVGERRIGVEPGDQHVVSLVCRREAQTLALPQLAAHFDPQAFLERARPVLRLYEQAKELMLAGIWVICVGEKTSIQARKLAQMPQPAQAGHPLHVSPRYERRGALQLFAGLSVADGQKYVRTAERKCFVDFQAFLTQIIIPEALRRGIHTIKLVLDNGPTHAPKKLQDWLQAQIQANQWPLTIEVVWLPINASWLDQIKIWFSILQQKLFQPGNFDSLEELTQSIMEFVKSDNQMARPIQWTYTVEKLERKLGTIL
jgi:hypothetical protein